MEQERGWARRLDDRAERLLNRRRLTPPADPEKSLRQYLLLTLVLSLVVTALLVLVLVVTGQEQRVLLVLGPLAGVSTAVLVGFVVMAVMKRR